MKPIDKNTAVSVGLVTMICSCIWYLSGVVKQVEANTRDISKLESMSEKINLIQTDVAVIKNELRSNRKKR